MDKIAKIIKLCVNVCEGHNIMQFNIRGLAQFQLIKKFGFRLLVILYYYLSELSVEYINFRAEHPTTHRKILLVDFSILVFFTKFYY